MTLPITEALIANPANNTNWFDEISRLGFQTSHNLSITGGNDNTKYLVSGNYFNQDGVIKNNGHAFEEKLDLDTFKGQIILFTWIFLIIALMYVGDSAFIYAQF